ncbi:hypothetical protein PT285_00945 [Lactobacillus sp. ESL0791]|uniref:hypothetical protein n=1 Tax=Lactobacillus sp. ESL0791 TaxID=2983234 RepID=UPI0023F8EE1E|nr:hypothetical protein [Lactobacillus sp. ESL0791]MDF7638005.1 hypothetical protein [Lactobacillus sp. ESL0791]
MNKKYLKKSVAEICFLLMGVSFIASAAWNWPDLMRSIGDFISCLVSFFLAFGLDSDRRDLKKGKKVIEDDERDNLVEHLADARTLKWLRNFIFLIGIVCLIVYAFYGKNMVWGIIAVVSLGYWNLCFILEIVFVLVENHKN